ncbi:uncharacterized protein AB675_11164 [Cyphellophora attinorum]|uniref:MARVEL domain-containing protein n=1 Tax=Cyphellophora attinorum TaxID=1664694 RepID=A0A0N0NIS4_9EURO|nr:uncharacterized protein AB675_11164 [Phialophora attinorum]KPI35789.1 hypothetical protein AB675_11164 [Phialophora attinorum]
MVSRVVNLGLRGLEFLFTLIVMALIGAMIAQASSGNPATVNYNIFVAVFGMLSLFYLIPAAFNDSFQGHALIPTALDLLNSLFFFAGATALAAGLGVHSCSNSEAQAATAFLYFAWACWTASAVFSFLGARGSGVNMRAPGIRKGRPVMSQV